LAACGSQAADLFLVHRAGSVPGAKLDLLVRDDGTVRCNRGPARRMTDPQLLIARQLQRDLDSAATNQVMLRPGPQSVFTYSVQTPAGRLRFSDTSPGLLPVFLRLAAFTRDVAKTVCRLPR
jgi:hypothetical protein